MLKNEKRRDGGVFKNSFFVLFSWNLDNLRWLIIYTAG